MQWKRNAGREQGGESNCSLGKSKKKKHSRLLPSRPAELPLLAEPGRRACFTTVKNHKSLLSGNISASPGCSTEIAFRDISQHLTVSRRVLLGIFFHFLWIIGAVKSFTWAQNYLKTEKKTKQSSSCILFCICKQSVPRKMKMCGKLISLLTVEASEAFQVLYSFQLTQAGKVNNKTVAWKC